MLICIARRPPLSLKSKLIMTLVALLQTASNCFGLCLRSFSVSSLLQVQICVRHEKTKALAAGRDAGVFDQHGLAETRQNTGVKLMLRCSVVFRALVRLSWCVLQR